MSDRPVRIALPSAPTGVIHVGDLRFDSLWFESIIANKTCHEIRKNVTVSAQNDRSAARKIYLTLLSTTHLLKKAQTSSSKGQCRPNLSYETSILLNRLVEIAHNETLELWEKEGLLSLLELPEMPFCRRPEQAGIEYGLERFKPINRQLLRLQSLRRSTMRQIYRQFECLPTWSKQYRVKYHRTHSLASLLHGIGVRLIATPDQMDNQLHLVMRYFPEKMMSEATAELFSKTSKSKRPIFSPETLKVEEHVIRRRDERILRRLDCVRDCVEVLERHRSAPWGCDR